MNNDLISRQAAIDLLKQMRKDGNMVPWEGKNVFARIRKLPPAQPEPKRGKWNKLDMDTFNCNQCGATFILNQGSEKMHFCPNCGADMRTKETGCDYERAVEQLEHDMLYEPTFNQDDGSM